MFPIETEVLQAYMPHRPPMIWIDRVLSSTTQGGTCEVVLRRDALYFQKGRLIPTASIEWIAQAAGYTAAARIHAGTTPGYKRLEQTFLVGIRNGKVPDLSALREGDRLLIHIEVVKQLVPLALIKGTLEANGRELGSLVLKVFGQSDSPALNQF